MANGDAGWTRYYLWPCGTWMTGLLDKMHDELDYRCTTIPQMDGDDDSSASAATTASRLGVSAAAQRREQHRLEGEGVTYQQRCDMRAPNIDVADFEYNSDDMPGDEQGPHADGSHADDACAEGDEEYVLSEYELERIERIRQHTAVLAGLGLRR